jgi:hypothetical protein
MQSIAVRIIDAISDVLFWEWRQKFPQNIINEDVLHCSSILWGGGQ